MSRIRVIYNVAGVMVGPAPCQTGHSINDFGEISNTGTINLLRPLHRVQSVAFSVNNSPTQITQLGRDDIINEDVINIPTVDLAVNYVVNGIGNENKLGFNVNYTDPNTNLPIFSGNSGFLLGGFLTRLDGRANNDIRYPFNYRDKRNIFVCLENEGVDFNTRSYSYEHPSSTGLSVLGFGNCYPTSYSTQGAVNSFSTSTVNFVSHNISFYNSGVRIPIPSVNSRDNNLTTGFFATIPSSFEGDNNLSAILPGNITVDITETPRISNQNIWNPTISFNDPYILRTNLASGVNNFRIPFVSNIGENPTLLHSIGNYNNDLMIFGMISGAGKDGFNLLTSDLTPDNGYYVNTFIAKSNITGTNFFKKPLTSGSYDHFIQFPSGFSSKPGVVYSISSDYDLMIFGMASGITTTGFNLLTSDYIPTTGYSVTVFASPVVNTDFLFSGKSLTTGTNIHNIPFSNYNGVDQKTLYSLESDYDLIIFGMTSGRAITGLTLFTSDYVYTTGHNLHSLTKFSNLNLDITSVYSNNPTITLPQNHGVNFNDIKIQNYQISLPIPRESLNNFGYRLPVDYRVKFPITATASFSAIVGELQSGSINQLIKNNSNYNVKINVKNNQNSGILQYDLRKGKFSNTAYDLSIGPNESINLSYTFEISAKDLSKGVFISGILGYQSMQNFTGLLAGENGSLILQENGQELFTRNTIIV